jgi:valyl-tRNA synthetase
MKLSLPKRPPLREIEKKWQKKWEEMLSHQFDPTSQAPIYSIDVPPRYVSGPLHIGHAVSYTHIDFTARYRRMRGFNVFNPLCVDANGLPVEVNVEKTGVSPREVGRRAFIEKCREYADKNQATIQEQFRRLGHTFDASLYYRTDLPLYRRVTQITFLELYEKGLVYQGERPVNFCPRCHTALADAEIEYQERETTLHFLKFHLIGDAPPDLSGVERDREGPYLVVATTRPELLAACQLVAVSPSDPRYRGLGGRYIRLPLYDRTVPLVEDEAVSLDFGTGAMMVCTFGDKDDIEWSTRYPMDIIVAIDGDGRLTEATGPYAGLTVAEGRERICQDLMERDLRVEDKPLSQRVGTCWRCNTPIEFIITRQWFLHTLSLKEIVLKAQEQIEWIPEFMRMRLVNWAESLSWDWCLSRQRFYATPIPVWICQDCDEVVLATKEQCYVIPTEDPPPVERCPICGGGLAGTTDVFDTWFDSSITPLVNCWYARDEKLFKMLYPMDLRPQSHDIIRTWAYYTILRCTQLTGEPPFKQIAISGFIIGPDGRPMHASWGNVVDPTEVIETYGTEALRYFAATCGPGVDTSFNYERTRHGVDFAVKLWNICRFVSDHIADFAPGADHVEYSPMDRWLQVHLSHALEHVTNAYDTFQFDRGLFTVERFTWSIFADNYLEAVKHRLYGENIPEANRRAALDVLYRTVLSILKMLAPLLPHVTEELFHVLFSEKEGIPSIHLTSWPDFRYQDQEALEAGDRAVEIISALRKWKQSNRMSLGTEVEELIVETPLDDGIRLMAPEIQRTLRIRRLTWRDGPQTRVVEP